MLPNDADPSIEKKMGQTHEWLLWIHLNEYVKLKDEQIARMRFRDNLLYVTLVAFGGIISYAIVSEHTQYYYAFLLLPWVCLILGWTYLVNDEKISSIGRYIRLALTEKLSVLVKEQPELLFKWEIFHRDDQWRKSRKFFQLLIDEITFCVSGLASIYFFYKLHPQVSDSSWIYLVIIEAILLFGLGLWIFIYADLRKGRNK
jgi:hypothetical protein